MQTDATSAKESALRKQWLSFNEGWEYVFLNDTAAMAFLTGLGEERHRRGGGLPGATARDYVAAFRKLIPGAMKADFLRLAWLYQYGGAYSDVDNEPGSLENFTGLADIVIPKSFGFPDDCVGHLYNAFMMANPGSKFLERALQVALERIQSSWKDSCQNCELTCYGIAGPTLLGEELCKALPLLITETPGRQKEHCTFLGGGGTIHGCTAPLRTTMAIDTGELVHLLEEHGQPFTKKLDGLPWPSYPGDCWRGRIYADESSAA